MSSGKQSKRRRAQVQAPQPRQQLRRRQASPRVLLAALIVIVVAGLGVGLGVALAGGSGSSLGKVPATGSLTGKLTLPNAAIVHRLFNGVPQRGNALGKASAPVTMVEYIDLQCPYCDQFELNVLPDLVSRYVKAGAVKIEAIPIAFIGPDSQRGRLAAIAAAKQNHMFDFMEVLYANQKTENTGWLSDSMVTRAAASIPGLDVPKLLADHKTADTATVAKSFDQSAKTAQVRETPTILVGKTGQSPKQVALRSPTDEASVIAAIAAASR